MLGERGELGFEGLVVVEIFIDDAHVGRADDNAVNTVSHCFGDMFGLADAETE